MGKFERQQKLVKYLQMDPFLTDKDLARILKVSIQTIRLDRTELKIPELRERLKNVARGSAPGPRAISEGEIVGELVELNVGSSGVSVIDVKPEMTLARNKVLRGHYLFAQANSLAVAVIDAGAALTGLARVSFKRPVACGEKVLARAVIKAKKGNKYMVKVTSYVGEEIVFIGRFLIFAVTEGEAVAQ